MARQREAAAAARASKARAKRERQRQERQALAEAAEAEQRRQAKEAAQQQELAAASAAATAAAGAAEAAAPASLPGSAPQVPAAERPTGQKQRRRKRQAKGQRAQQTQPEPSAGQAAGPSEVHAAPEETGNPLPASSPLPLGSSVPAAEAAPAAVAVGMTHQAAEEEEGSGEDPELQSLLQALGLGAPAAPATPGAALTGAALTPSPAAQQQSPGGHQLGMLAGVGSEPAAAGPAPEAAPDTSCVCCMERQRAAVLVPCGHRAFCMPCARSLFEGQQGWPCPFCRKEVSAGALLFYCLASGGLYRRRHG